MTAARPRTSADESSRIVFAMSRDSRFPAYRLMQRVDPRTQTPIPATTLIFAVGVILMVALPGKALLELIVASTILPAVIYGMTICLYLAVRRRLESKEGAFNLRRFELPVAIAALVWVLVALFILVVPAEAVVPDLIVVGFNRRGRVILLRPADIQQAGARDRARGRRRLHALIER